MADILIPLTNTAGDGSAVDFAVHLAHGEDSHLTLIQAVELLLPGFGSWGVDPIERRQVAAFLKDEEASRAAGSIRHKLTSLDVPYALEVEDGRTGAPLTAIARRAQVFDYAVTACAGRSSAERRRQSAVFSAVALESGRPVFAVPGDYHAREIKRALVAWSSTHESARATHDFLGLRFDCDLALVTVARPAGLLDDSGHQLIEAARRKGRGGSFSSIPRMGRTVSAALLSHADEIGADLIVCGAYGHSRAREWMLGGTTKDLFIRSRVPIFFSR